MGENREKSPSFTLEANVVLKRYFTNMYNIEKYNNKTAK